MQQERFVDVSSGRRSVVRRLRSHPDALASMDVERLAEHLRHRLGDARA